MRVVITGGSGKAGRYTIRELLEHGYQVTNVDRVPPVEALCPFVRVELADMGQVYGALVGHEGVVHLAAIADPSARPPEVVFRNNVMSTFNVIEAATNLGYRRVIVAGSEAALGLAFTTLHPLTTQFAKRALSEPAPGSLPAGRRFAPRYLPIDEEHPLTPEDPYGLSKIVVEEICRVASRRTGVPTVSLRFSWIRAQEEFAGRFPPIWEHPERGAFNLWSYVGARDVGRACRLALEAETEGFEAFYIAAAETYMKTPTRELVRRFFPEVTEFREGWGGYDSALSCAKAGRLLGWEPRQSWRTVLAEDA